MTEAEFVVSVIQNDRVWRWLKVDGVEKELVRYEPSSTYFVNENGFVMYRQIYPSMWEVHIVMTKAKNVVEFGMETMQKMREKGVKKFLAPIGEWNTPALKLAAKCGFKETGRISKAFQRDGVSKSLIFMGAE